MSKLGRIYALNAVNLASLTLAQILIVPFLLRYMGVEGFESWTFISAAALICQLFDFGLVFYSCNSARIAYGAGDTQGAERIIGQALSYLLFLFVPFTLFPLAYYGLASTPASLALSIMLFSTPLTMIRYWMYYVLTARTSQIGELVLLVSFTLAQTALLIFVIMSGGNVVQLAVAFVASAALFGVVPAWIALRRYAPELRLYPRKVEAGEIKPLIQGSLHNFSYSGASVVTVYLPVILLGIIPGLPAGSLATFSASRTLTGVVRQFCQQLARSNVIEISRYLAPEHGQRMRRMFLLGSALISVLAAIGMGALLPVADLVLGVWTGKPELYNPAVIRIFCIGAVISAQVQLPMVLPQFTNTARMMVIPLALQVILIAVLGLAGGYYFAAPGMVGALVIAELSTLGTVSLLRIIPTMGIGALRFLALTGGPSVAAFAASAGASWAARALVHPHGLVGLACCGALWAVVMLPFSAMLYLAAKRYRWS